MNVYWEREKQELFGTNNNVTPPTVRAIMYNKRRPPQSTNNAPRQRIHNVCECCGIAGHDVRTTGCDFAASLMLANDFLQQNRSMK